MYTKKRRPNDRAYSKEYVQLLEEQQTALIKGVKELYRRSLTGEVLPDLPSDCDERMLIHEVLTSLDILPKRSESFDMEDHQHADSSVASSACSPVHIQSLFPESRVPILSRSPSSLTENVPSPAVPSIAEFEGFMSTFDNEQLEGIQSLMQSLHKSTENNFPEVFAEPYLIDQNFLGHLPPSSQHFVNPRDMSFDMPYHMGRAYTT